MSFPSGVGMSMTLDPSNFSGAPPSSTLMCAEVPPEELDGLGRRRVVAVGGRVLAVDVEHRGHDLGVCTCVVVTRQGSHPRTIAMARLTGCSLFTHMASTVTIRCPA